MKNKIYLILFILNINNILYAVDTPCLNPFASFDWNHMTDDTLIGSYGDGEESGTFGKTGCECITEDDKAIAGFRARVTLPIGFVEVVDKPNYFPCFQDSQKAFVAKQKLNGTPRRGTGSSDNSGGFRIGHFISYPIAKKLNVDFGFGSFGIFVEANPGIPFLGELEPEWYDDFMAVTLEPKAILFNNPIAQLACIYDCVKSTITNTPVDWMTWCVGCWGAMKNAAGRGDGTNEIVEAALMTVRVLTFMHRTGRLQQTIPVDMTMAPFLSTMAENDDTVACAPITFPEIIKSQYRYNLSYPYESEIMDTGVYPLIWENFQTDVVRPERILGIWRRTAVCAGVKFGDGD